jgi:ATP-dependent Lon protease
MKESAQAAVSYVRAHSGELGLPDDYFAKHDIHVHVPAGAIPKDGPSAGVTMATAVASLVTGTPVSADVAMTGEVTLTGQVLPIGGLKEKTLAAQRAGITTVIMPARNEADLEDVPEELRKGMRFVPVERVEQVWKAAMGLEMNGRRARRRPEAVAAVPAAQAARPADERTDKNAAEPEAAASDKPAVARSRRARAGSRRVRSRS